MSSPDDLIAKYWRLGIDSSDEEVGTVERGRAAGENPRDWKRRLAHALVTQYHGDDAAEAAEARFDRVNVTPYVPAAAYVCDAVTPVPVEPSPKFHAYDTIEPSGSDDPDTSTDTAKPDTSAVNDAVGGWFATGSCTVTC